jgi:uncharacterized protein (TIGR03083 family)
MSRIHGTKDFWLAATRAEGASLLSAVQEPNVLGRGVPSCPEWTVGELLRHVGAVYRRTRTHAVGADATRPWGRVVVPEDAPGADDPNVVAWFESELAQITEFLDAIDPHSPAWNWAPQAKTTTFWLRRTAHETAVHRWDAQLGAGLLPEPIEAKVAADGVAEVLDTFLPSGRRSGPTDLKGMVRLVATDLAQDWFLRLRGEGIALLDTATLLDADAHPARAIASGTASDILLALWGRVAFDVLETGGDPRLLEALRTC